jgi:hypothetical protein
MSKGGGAGKVYFVLYLAVVLELLIIIVERDEAEESLRQKQKETMKIVESILSQLQSGAGTEGINTRPQDEITIPPQGINLEEVMGSDIKSYRRYIVEVGVTDVSQAIKKQVGETEKDYVQRLKKLVELANVEEIEYQIFYSPSEEPDKAPPFISDDEIQKLGINFMDYEPGQMLEVGPIEGQWKFLGVQKLKLDKEATFNKLDLTNVTPESIHPVYPKEMKSQLGPAFAPEGLPDDSVFFYSRSESVKETMMVAGEDLKKRSFVVNFRPPGEAGWYKLRFASRTNKILGVRADVPPDELSDETTVNIGTVQLTVEDLRTVHKELALKLEKYDLPTYETLAETGDIQKFDQQLKEAISTVKNDEDAIDIIGKINLYGYIAKLLTPGMSVNFDQNRGSMEFDIRVITPRPQIAEPVVKLPNYVPSFDEIAPVFEFTISPYQGETANAVQGRVLDNSNNVVARIDLRPLDQISGLDVVKPAQGAAREYRGIINKELAPGRYSIEVTHQLAGRSETKTTPLEVFETTLTEESEQKINFRLDAFAFYGYKMLVNPVPTSGGKIKSNQFRIYLKTDKQEQRPPIEGLSVTQDEALELTPDADKVGVRISWVQPYTNKEVDLYPLKWFSIQQEQPGVITRNLSTEVSGTPAKLKVRVTGIDVTSPQAGPEQSANVEVDVGQPEKADGLKTYEFSIEPTIDGDPDAGYTVYLEMAGNLPRGEDKVRGTIRIPVLAYAINPINGKSSEEVTEYITVQLNYEPERGGRRRRR